MRVSFLLNGIIKLCQVVDLRLEFNQFAQNCLAISINIAIQYIINYKKLNSAN